MVGKWRADSSHYACGARPHTSAAGQGLQNNQWLLRNVVNGESIHRYIEAYLLHK